MQISKEILKQKLQHPLPGKASQLKMAPINNDVELGIEMINSPEAKQSSVLILLFIDNEKLKTVFIKRSEYDGVHSGQISFPGGKKEKSDVSFEATALRETHEEIGVKPEKIEIIGQLTDLFIKPSNFCVKVFVGFCSQKPDFEPDRREVQEVIEIDLDEFLNPKAVVKQEFHAKALNSMVTAPCFSINNTIIWGATAMIMSELLDILKGTGYQNHTI